MVPKVAVPGPDTWLQVIVLPVCSLPVWYVWAVPARVVESTSQRFWSVPALAPDGFSLKSMVTSSETVQVPFVSVHLNTYVPYLSTDTVEVGEVMVPKVAVPGPDTWLQVIVL